jgi:hypothetical protein
MTPEEIFTALAAPEGLPRAAMVAAGERREEMIPVFLDLIHRLRRSNTSSVADDDLAVFLFAYFLLGEWGDPRAYRPLAALLRHNPEFLEQLLGDAITEGTARVMAAVCDGDLNPIIDIIADPDADQFIRGQMIDTLVLIARERTEKAPEVASFLEGFFAAEFGKDEIVWESWAFAVAELGLGHLEPQVVQVYENEWISPELSEIADFRQALEEKAEPGTSSWFQRSRNTGPIESAIEDLSRWHCFSDQYTRAKARRMGLRQSNGDTFERDSPKIGRNDPCPCGSGKKYKKCCLQ